MATLGNVPAEAYTNTVKDSFSGNGSATAFTMSLPTVTNDVRVVVENVIQDPTVAYSVSGTTLTFTSAPPTGTNNIYVVHLGPAVMTTVPPAEIADATTFASSLTVQGAFTSQGIDDNADAVALTIDSSENVMVGTTNDNPAGANVTGHALGPSGYISSSRDGGFVVSLNRKTNDGDIAVFRKDGTTVGAIGTGGGGINFNSQGSDFAIRRSGTDVLYVGATASYPGSDNSKDLGVSSFRWKDAYLSGGVYLGGTVAANKLDDYEYGTWTPSFVQAPAGTVSSLAGQYVKVGKLVTVYCQVTGSSLNATDYVRLQGLPFSASDKNATGTYIIGGITNRIHGWTTLTSGTDNWYWSTSSSTSATSIVASVTYKI